MIVFTCINAAMTDAAVIWAHSLRKATRDGEMKIDPYLFHTPDVDTSRFVEFGINCVQINHPNAPKGMFSPSEMHGMTMRLRVLDLMIERNFADVVLYTDVDVLFQKNLDELGQCPLNDRVWLSARNDNVFFDCKRNGKFYKDHAPYYEHKAKMHQDYFNSGVLLIKLSGLEKAVKRKGFDLLMDYYESRADEFLFPDQDCMNTLIGEYFNLFDRYNAFADMALQLDFGDLLARRDTISSAHIIHFAGNIKPWSGDLTNGLPLIPTSQYPYESYLAACNEVRTFLTPKFYNGVKAMVKNHSLMIEWQREIRGKSGPLKQRLADFKEKLD